MDKEIIKNIEKVSFLNEKLEILKKLLEVGKYAESYKAIGAMIETVCIITIEKLYNIQVKNSNIVVLAEIFDQYNEKRIKDLLVSINGEYNLITLNEVKEIEVLVLLGNLDDLIKVILEEHGNIF